MAMLKKDKSIEQKFKDLKEEYEFGFGGVRTYFSPEEMIEKGIGTDKNLIKSLKVNLKIPINYIISQEGIFEKTFDGEGNKIVVKISDDMIIPTALIYYLDDDRIDVEISYYKNGEWKQEYVEKRNLLDRNRLLELNKFGLNISCLNVNGIIAYFYSFFVDNPNLKSKKITNKLGWIQNHTGYIPIRNNDVELSKDKGFVNMIEGFECKGTIEGWIKEIEKYRENPYFRFVLSARIRWTISRYRSL